MTTRSRAWHIAIIALVLTASLTIGTVAFAQSGDDEAEPSESVPSEGETDAAPADARPDRRAFREEHRAAFLTGLAERLGLDVATVETAVEDTREELKAARRAEREAAVADRLDQAVEDGRLTQEQADALSALAESAEDGDFEGFGPKGSRSHGFGGHGPRGFGFSPPGN